MSTHCCFRSLLVSAILLPLSLAAQTQSPQIAPADLVKQVIYNELHPPAVSNLHWKYRLQKEVDGKKETRTVVETRSGSLDRLVMMAGKPLTPEQENAETERIMRFIHNPEQQHKAEQARQKDAQQCDQILQMIPGAFLFQYDGGDQNAVKVTFKPNPQFHPSSREGKVLQQMAGEMWLDSSQKRLISITGRLNGEVKFGGGLLGHLEQGGNFVVQRAEIAPGDWELTQMVVNMHGKALLFKSISVQQKEIHSNFERMPGDITLAKAASLLLHQTLVAVAQSPR